MKRLLAVLALVLLVGTGVGLATYDAAPAPSYALPRAATLPLYAKASEAAVCSGVMIAPQLMLTAAHCTAAELIVNDSPVTVLAKDEESDVALLQVNAACPCVPIGDPSMLDEFVIVVGFPMNDVVRQQVVSEGRSQGETLLGNKLRRVLFTAPVIGGNSGGGLFALRNGRWELVGIISAVTIKCDLGYGCSFITHLAYAATPDGIRAILLKV